MMNEKMGKNQVIIVCRKKHEGMSHLMAQLISEHYEEHEVAEWDEKHWLANKAAVVASQKVVFLGSAGANYQHGIKWHFDKFSMRYGWRANRAVLDVRLLSVLDIKKFRNYAEQHAEDAEFSYKKMAGATGIGIGASMGAAGAAGIGAAGIGAGAAGVGLAKFAALMVGIKFLPLAIVGGPVAAAIYLNSLKKYQYPLLVKEFVLEGAYKNFMEG